MTLMVVEADQTVKVWWRCIASTEMFGEIKSAPLHFLFTLTKMDGRIHPLRKRFVLVLFWREIGAW